MFSKVKRFLIIHYLKRQIKTLKEYGRGKGWEIQILKDIGSGLNENRKNYRKLLELLVKGEVSKVVITYLDRLTRFSFKTLEFFLHLPECESKLESRSGLVVCECEFKADKQFLGAFNVFVRGFGVALSGGETNDLLSNEPGGELRLMSPKSLVRVDLSGRMFTHVPP